MGSSDGEHNGKTLYTRMAWLDRADDAKPLYSLGGLAELSWTDVYISSSDTFSITETPWMLTLEEAPGLGGLPLRTYDQRLPVPSQVQHHLPEVEGQVEEHSLEQVQTMVVKEVLKDVNTACKLLNIPADPSDWSCLHVQKWLLWTEHLYRLPQSSTAFPQMSGKELCVMTEADFRQCSSQFGDVLFAHLDIWRSAAAMKTRSETEDSKTAANENPWSEAQYPNQPIHLWQFLRELLLKPHNYSRCIRWLNKEKGIFKIEDSAHVARLWGIRKNRPAMNYDKLSRSIRQYYKKGIIRKPELSGRLIYQFVIPV